MEQNFLPYFDKELQVMEHMKKRKRQSETAWNTE